MASSSPDLEFEALLGEVRKRLPQYLEEHKVSFNDQGWFRCIHPDHEDKNPSCHFVEAEGVGKNTRFKCFGCGAAGDIFTAATLLEKRPTEGKGWVVENVYYLADRFKIPHKKTELTEKELVLLKQQRLYDDAADLLVSYGEQFPESYANAKARGLYPETCQKFGIGSVPWPTMKAALVKKGWNEEFVRASGIDQGHFHERHLTFTLRNMNGQVVGFDRRYMDYDEKIEQQYRDAGRYYPPKYMATSQKRCRLIHKETLLLNIHWARERPLRRLDVFEGFTDFYTAYQAGHLCCTSTCGSNFTDLMVAVIVSCGFSHVNLVYDSDSTGISKMTEALEKFKGHEGIHVTIMPLQFHESVPLGQRDVDYYLQAFPTPEEGLAGYMAHQPISAFDWMLEQRIREGGHPLIIAKDMVGFIVNTTSQMDRGHLCSTLAIRLGLAERDVRAEVERICDQQIDELVSMAAVKINRANNTDQRVKALTDGFNSLRSLSTARNDASFTPLESAQTIRSTFEEFKQTDPGVIGWKTGLSNFDDHIKGVPKKHGLLIFGGVPNCGKSATLLNFTEGIIDNNDEPAVLLLSFDDSRQVSQAKLASLVSDIPIMYIRQPQEGQKFVQNMWARFKAVEEKITAWAESGRLIIKGREIGNNVDAIEKSIQTAQDLLGRPLVVIVDSFHKVRAGRSTDERLNFKAVSDWCNRVIVEYETTIICSANCPKEAMKKARLRYDDLGETAEISYDAKFVGMVHNDMHNTRGNTQIYWNDGGTPRPILEIDVDKNKITSFKLQTLYYRFKEDTAKIWAVEKEDTVQPKTKPAQPMSTPRHVMGAPGA